MCCSLRQFAEVCCNMYPSQQELGDDVFVCCGVREIMLFIGNPKGRSKMISNGVMQLVKVSGSVLLRVVLCCSVCCSMLQCASSLTGAYKRLVCVLQTVIVVVYCNVLQYAAMCCSVLQRIMQFVRMLQCVAVCCSVYCAVYCSVLQCVAVCCSVLQCVMQCNRMLQFVSFVARARTKLVCRAVFFAESDKAPTNKICRRASSEQRPRTRSCHESEHLV